MKSRPSSCWARAVVAIAPGYAERRRDLKKFDDEIVWLEAPVPRARRN